MPLTDRDKIDIVTRAFVDKLNSFETFDDLRNALSNLTKDQLKTFIRDSIQDKAQSMRDASAGSSGSALDLDSLDADINNW